MNVITVRETIKAKDEGANIWEIKGIDTPVRYVTVHILPVEQNILQVKVHEDAIKTLRLKKLREWKKMWKLSKICGYNARTVEFMHVYLPPSWMGYCKENPMLGTYQIRPMLYWFLRYLLDGAHKEF